MRFLFLIFVFIMISRSSALLPSSPVDEHSEEISAGKNRHHRNNAELNQSVLNRRDEDQTQDIQEDDLERFRDTLVRHAGNARRKETLCRYKRCLFGQECQIAEGKATCICRKTCAKKHNPVCGTDSEYYENHCEMHKHACQAKAKIYDARNKDCFYKASNCSQSSMKQFKEMLIQFYQSILRGAEAHHAVDRDSQNDEIPSEENNLNRKRRSVKAKRFTKHGRILPGDRTKEKVLLDGHDNTIPTYFDNGGIDPDTETKMEQDFVHSASSVDQLIPPTRSPGHPRKISIAMIQNIEASEVLNTAEEDISTKDAHGKLIKFIFALLDLDLNGKVVNEEIDDVSSLQRLREVLPGPCNLFHVLKSGDDNGDGALDIMEAFKLFDVKVLRLRKNERVVGVTILHGMRAELHCGIEGEFHPKWRRYGLMVKEEDGIRIAGRVLHLRYASFKSAGNYTCTARVKQNMTQTIRVGVTIAPEVEVHPPYQHATLQSSATIKCHVEGRPTPRIRWERNGKPLNSGEGRYVFMANNTELHFNYVEEDDDAAYSCVAENSVGRNEGIAALYVDSEISYQETNQGETVGYFAFHENGISIVDPGSCREIPIIEAEENVPGLLIQNKLCGLNNEDERICQWGESVSVGDRFIYTSQPSEDRILVLDKKLQKIVEVISTDVMPVELHYIKSSDQMVVVCWLDDTRNGSSIQVIHAAAEFGVHFAERIRPSVKSGQRHYDMTIGNVFIPPEDMFNPNSMNAYITHENHQRINVLDLNTLTYRNTIDFTHHNCFPATIGYLPIGGLLHVLCRDRGGNQTIHSISIDLQSLTEVSFQKDTKVTKEYFSPDYSYVINLLPDRDEILLYNISNNGEIRKFMKIRTNFQVNDVHFARKKHNQDEMMAYMTAGNQGNIMHVDLVKERVELISGNTTPFTAIWPWKQSRRKLVADGWFGRFLATAGSNGIEILSLNTNQMLCNMDQIGPVSSLTWSGTYF